ncbi:MAG: DinB family protein [Clostridium sp.]|jgi:hypothetical protein|nr:DinB family protein [Clostridium sp.]
MSLISDWNPKQTELKTALAHQESFEEAIKLCLELHGSVHSGAVSRTALPTIFDGLWNGLSHEAFVKPPARDDGFGRKATIAWNIWHITRIEDITANILIADGIQILDDAWLGKLGVSVTDTGNPMSEDEIAEFSDAMKMEALLRYRNAVGTRTREIILGLSYSGCKRKMKPESVQRILAEGGVTEHKDSIWLLDFWGKKNVAGILLMPITRHQIMHISHCFKLKNRLQFQRNGIP